MECVARWELANTTPESVAGQAGWSRATVYRMFPGGEDPLQQAAARAEVQRAGPAMAAEMEGGATLTGAVVVAAR